MPDTQNLSRDDLKKRFLAGMKPSESDFADLIASQLNSHDDHLYITPHLTDSGRDMTLGLDDHDTIHVVAPTTLSAPLTADAPTVFSQKMTVTGAAQFDHDVQVTGSSTFSAPLTATAPATFRAAVTVNGLTTLEDTTIRAAAHIEGDLTVSGHSVLPDVQSEQLTTHRLKLGRTQVSDILNTDLQQATAPEQQLATIAAIREYIAATSLGLTLRAQARVVATEPCLLHGLPTLDGVVLAEGDFVLLTAQDTQRSHPDNRLWQVSSAHWTRAEETDGTPFYELERGTAILITDGTHHGGKLWVMDGDATVPSWQQRTDLDYLRAGMGLQKNGLNLSLKLATPSGLHADASGLAVVAGNGVKVDASGTSVRTGNGLQLEGNSVAVRTGAGLDATGGPLSLKLAATSGLQADASGTSVRTGNGLQLEGNSVAVRTGAGLDATGGPLSLKLATPSGLHADASGTSVRTGNGLQLEGNSVAVKTGAGLDATGGSLSLKLAASNSGLLSDAAGLRVQTATSLQVSGNQLGINFATLDSDYLNRRIVFVLEGTSEETTSRINAAFSNGALLVGTYRS